MESENLSDSDIAKLKTDIKLSLLLSSMLFALLLVFMAVVLFVIFLLGNKPASYFRERIIYITGLLILPFLFVAWKDFLRYLDIKKGKKLSFTSRDYEIALKKEKAFLVMRDQKRKKIELDKDLIPSIKTNQPITVEISSISKSLLFLSNDKTNLLERKKD